MSFSYYLYGCVCVYLYCLCQKSKKKKQLKSHKTSTNDDEDEVDDDYSTLGKTKRRTDNGLKIKEIEKHIHTEGGLERDREREKQNKT